MILCSWIYKIIEITKIYVHEIFELRKHVSQKFVNMIFLVMKVLRLLRYAFLKLKIIEVCGFEICEITEICIY